MEKVAGGEDPATRAAGGMCDRFLTFLAKNLTMSRTKTISDAPKNGGAGGHIPAEDGEEDDEFAIPIERAEFDYAGGNGDGGGYSGVATILGETAAATTTTTTRDVPDEPNPEATAAAAADDGTVAAGSAPAATAAVEETKVRKTVTIKEEEGGDASAAATTTTVERKRSSLFKKRQASSAAAGGDERAAPPRRSGLRPRMPPPLRVPSNINERSSTFIEERKKSFGRGGKPAPDK